MIPAEYQRHYLLSKEMSRAQRKQAKQQLNFYKSSCCSKFFRSILSFWHLARQFYTWMSGKGLDRFARAFSEWLSNTRSRERWDFPENGFLDFISKELSSSRFFQLFICRRGVFAEKSTKKPHTIFSATNSTKSTISESEKWRKLSNIWTRMRKNGSSGFRRMWRALRSRASQKTGHRRSSKCISQTKCSRSSDALPKWLI